MHVKVGCGTSSMWDPRDPRDPRDPPGADHVGCAWCQPAETGPSVGVDLLYWLVVSIYVYVYVLNWIYHDIACNIYIYIYIYLSMSISISISIYLNIYIYIDIYTCSAIIGIWDGDPQWLMPTKDPSFAVARMAQNSLFWRRQCVPGQTWPFSTWQWKIYEDLSCLEDSLLPCPCFR